MQAFQMPVRTVAAVRPLVTSPRTSAAAPATRSANPCFWRRQSAAPMGLPLASSEIKSAPKRRPTSGRRRAPVLEAGAGEATPAEDASPGSIFNQAVTAEQQLYVNSVIVSAFVGSILVKIVTVDGELWRGWTLWEILTSIPADNWASYQVSLEQHPLLTPMLITGLTYFLADWIAQTYEGNALLKFSAERLLRSTVTGLLVLGPLAHTYYTTQDALFLQWWPDTPLFVDPLKMAIDQTFYCFFYNFLYYLSQGLLSGKSVSSILLDFKGAWWRLQKAGWRIWPFVGVITHTIIPTEHKVLFVDAVEVGWVAFLSLTANSKRAANKEVMEDVMTVDEGNVLGEQSVAAVDALQTYVAEVRENTWVNELTPPAEDVALPDDSMPQDHLLLANELESAISDKLAKVEVAALTFSDDDPYAEIPAELLLSSATDVGEMQVSMENLVAEGIATMMSDAEEQQQAAAEENMPVL